MTGDESRSTDRPRDLDRRPADFVSEPSVGLSDEQRPEFNRIVFQFEDAWQQSGPQDIAAFLPVDGTLRRSLLQELVRIDFEYRHDGGTVAEPRDYLTLFPELATDPMDWHQLMLWFDQFLTKSPVHFATEVSATSDDAYWAAIKPGTVLGNYTIIELIGHGGMGAVFKAQHKHMNRLVALKTISPAAMKSNEAIQRFHREVRAAARLDHPNIVTAHDADQINGLHILIMQYVDGSDLSTSVIRQGPLTVDDAIDCLTQAASGLEYAHRQGVIHRDIKPANLIRNQTGQLKILDMGLARVEDSLAGEAEEQRHLTATHQLVGTPDFMAPEQAINAKSAGCPADVYSLGCTLFYLLAGRTMFGRGSYLQKTLAHRDSDIPRLQSTRSDVPDWLEATFQRMVAKRPEDRFQSMSDLLKVLSTRSMPMEPTTAKQSQPASSGIAFDSYLTLEPGRSHLQRRRRPVDLGMFAMIGAACFVVLVAGYVIRQQSNSVPAAKQTSATEATTLPPEAPQIAIAADSASKAASLPVTFLPIDVTAIAADTRYSVLVSNGILLSPDNSLFDESDRRAIADFQGSLRTAANSLTLFFGNRFDIPADCAEVRIHLSSEKCLTAWIVMRDGQRPERLDVGLDERDLVVDPKGASSMNLVVIAFPASETAAEHLSHHGMISKVRFVGR